MVVAAGINISIFTSTVLQFGLGRAAFGPLIEVLGVVLVLTVWVAFATAIPALVIVNVIRNFGLRRGYSDTLVPAGIGCLLSLAVIDLWFSLGFTAAGAAGGFTYWHFAGRPRPPY